LEEVTRKIYACKSPGERPYRSGHAQHEAIGFPEEVHSVAGSNTELIAQLLGDDDLTLWADRHSHTVSITVFE